MPIAEWEEFAPFAEQAGLLREKRAEEKAVVRAADADKKRGIAKSILAVSVVVALAGVGAVWFLTRRGTRNEDVVVSNDRGGAVVVNGDIKGKKQTGRRRPWPRRRGGGGFSGGQSYEAVLNSNNESITMGESQDSPTSPTPSSRARCATRRSSPGCGAPDDMKVQVRVAVRMGVPIGVTVSTTPPSAGVAALHRPRRPRPALAGEPEDRLRHHELLIDRRDPDGFGGRAAKPRSRQEKRGGSRRGVGSPRRRRDGEPRAMRACVVSVLGPLPLVAASRLRRLSSPSAIQ